MLSCADGTLYTGRTTDLEKRLREHNESKRGAKYTRTRRPVVLAHAEKCRTLSQALKREYALKQLTRAEKLALIRRS